MMIHAWLLLLRTRKGIQRSPAHQGKLPGILLNVKNNSTRRWNRKKVLVPVQTLQMTPIQRHKSPEKKDADEQSDIDLEDMLEKSESNGNNVQTDVEPEQLDQVENIDQGVKTDNVQIDTEERVIGELSEGTESADNNSKPSASEEKETDDNKQDENQVTDKKQDDTVPTEKPINDITEQNDKNPEDMQIEQQKRSER